MGIDLKGRGSLIIAFGLLVLVWLGIYWGHFSILLGHWNKEDYSHSYLVVPVFLYLLWISKDKITAMMGGSSSCQELWSLFWP
jgi:hypothetical protein